MQHIDSRQVDYKPAATALSNGTATELDNLLGSINSELTPSFLLTTNGTTVITVGPAKITNPETSRNRLDTPLGDNESAFTGGTVTFVLASSGAITVSPGTNSSLPSLAASQFVKIGIQIDRNGNLSTTQGSVASSLAAATNPTPTTGNQAIGYVVIRTNGASVVQNIVNSDIYKYSGGSGSGSGSGSGEINAISNSSESTSWAVSAAGITVATSTTATDLPLNPVIVTSIKIVPSSGTPYVLYRFTMPEALKNRKLKIEWHQRPLAGYNSGDLKLEMHTNTAANYSGTDATLPLSTDVSGLTSISSISGKFTSSFDANGSDYYELRLIRVAGTIAINLANVIVGPGIQPQGAVNSDWLSFTPTGSWTGSVTYTGKYRRVGDTMEVKTRVTTSGVPTGTLLTVNMPSGFTIDTSKFSTTPVAADLVNVGIGSVYDSGTNYGGLNITYNSTSSVAVYIENSTTSGVQQISATYPFSFNTADFVDISYSVPVAEWSGNGTLNIVSNDVEYVSNSNTSTSASDTTSFVYSLTGVNFVAVSSAGSTVKKRVRAIRPLGANSGKPVLEVSPDGILWMQSESQLPYMESGTDRYGMRLVAGGTALTDIDVEFGGDGANGSEAWSVYTAWKWRVTIQQPGVAIGFGLADANFAGLISANAQTIGGNKTLAGNLQVNGTFLVSSSGTGSATITSSATNANAVLEITGKGTGFPRLSFFGDATLRHTIGIDSSGPGGTNGLYWFNGSAYTGGISTAGIWTVGVSGETGFHTLRGGLDTTVGVKLPTSGGTASTLNYYEEWTGSSTASTGAITTAATLRVTRIGRLVTVHLPAVLGTASATANFEFGEVLPTRFRPATTFAVSQVTIQDGTIDAVGMARVQSSSGLVRIYRDTNETSVFTAAASCGLPYAVTFSYYI